MANPNFNPATSTYEIYRGDDMTRCFHDEYEAMEQSVAEKAPMDHTHDGYAAAEHSHTGYAGATHTHAQSDVTGLPAAMAAKADLVDGKVPESQLPSYVDDVVDGTLVNTTTFNDADGVAVTPEGSKVYNDTTSNTSYRWSGTQYVALNGGIALGETAATAHRGDHGKIAYDHSQNGNVHVTSEQKANWDSKAAGEHNHDAAYIAKAMLMMADNGGVKYTYAANSGANMLTTLAALGVGMHTAYFAAGLGGNPNTTEAFRVFIHKTGETVGWLFAFGSSGSVYANYQYGATTFRGWRAIFEANPVALWSGVQVVNGEQTITPTKPLSACRSGWLLVWSDYDTATGTAGTGDVCTTIIPRKNGAGANWSGQSFLAVVPTNMDADTDAFTCKRLFVHDSYFVGHAHNGVAPRNDVVLRAVYEL